VQAERPDVVLPRSDVFSHRKKSAAVKKECVLFQQLLAPTKMLMPTGSALSASGNASRVKRPRCILFSRSKTNIEMQGKGGANQLDVYLTLI